MNFLRRVFLAAFDGPAVHETERRQKSDRRKKPTSPWAAFSPAGQRVACRRAEEHRRPYFVDRFASSTFLVIMMLVVASLLDAILTIQLLGAGAQEVNPVMDGLLLYGIEPFLLGKYVLTVAGLPLLLIFKNHYLFGTRFRVGYLIPATVALYAVLIGYQLMLMQQID